MLDKVGYQKEIDSSIEELAKNGPQSRQAYRYLRDLKYDPHGVAAQSLLRALHEPSNDLKTVAALALGRLGRGVKGVTDALVHLMEKNQDEPFVFSASVHALASLQEPASIAALVAALDKSACLPDEVETFQVTCRFMGPAGASLLPYLSELSNMVSRVPKDQPMRMDALNELVQKTTSAGRALYHSFLRSGYTQHRGDYLGNEPLVFTKSRAVGDLSILLDQRVRYASGENSEERSMYSPAEERQLHETRLVVVGRADGSRVAIAVNDFMTSYSMAWTFKSLANGFIRALEQTKVPAQDIILGIFEPGTPQQPQGEFTPEAQLDKEGFYQRTDPHDDNSLDQWAQGSGKALRDYLSEPPKLSVDLLQYLEGSIRDERIRQRCLVHQAQAPEHTLHYSELQWDFPSDYTRVALGETSPQEPVTIFADSFDTQRDAEFFGKTLPQSISEFLTRCKLVCQLEEYVAPGDERWLDWPPPQDLDPELIMDKARPFELTHPRDHRQLLLNVDPRVHGVFVCRAKDQDGEYYIVSNVPSTVFNRSTTYEWGYDGAGPSDLALNILNYFMPPGSDGAEPQQMPECYWSRNQRSSASETAVKLAGKFKEEFIRNLPAWGGVIAASRIKAWLLRQAAEQS